MEIRLHTTAILKMKKLKDAQDLWEILQQNTSYIHDQYKMKERKDEVSQQVQAILKMKKWKDGIQRFVNKVLSYSLR